MIKSWHQDDTQHPSFVCSAAMMIESQHQLAEMDFFDQKPNEIFVLHPQIIQHKLSHQNLYIRFFQLNFDVKLPDSKLLTEIEKLPFPIVIHNFMASNYFNSL